MTSDTNANRREAAHPARSSLRKALRRALERSRLKAEKLRAELDDAERARESLEAGELLKANAEKIPARAESVTLPDFHHGGRDRVIALDPRLGALDNARRYFKRFKKREKSRDPLRSQLDNARAEAGGLEALLDDVMRWERESPPEEPPPSVLAKRAEALRVHVPGLAADGASPGGGVRSQRGERRPRGPALAGVARRFTSKDGLDIWVGQSAADNDALSLRCANGNDWWLHVAHHTGSHVVVKGLEQKGKGERAGSFLPQETLLDAAHLAVHYSKARNASRAEVDYTQAKNVRKPRGAPAGLVSLSQHKVLSLRLEASRLERLLRGG